ncbi:Histidine kinase-, DNA gyrase B-, and HSP90-like ATPase [Rhodoblastus acidophilus]|uniref:histidine kinase n=1 Tax=Rhodoblastus acidophilus TaxID=1074 RepID=A0A212PY66_RHOAC|nr:Histidine kinase-, DNA gyrase B-, and HSP90-like ATPase [Rhodoblastus acidophilus]
MLRNLLANALKYTREGKVLLNCRRQGATMSLEVWDTGIGIPEAEIHTIFEEYHQIDNEARERSRGLGLSIVRWLSNLLGHRVRARIMAMVQCFQLRSRLRRTRRQPRRRSHGAGTWRSPMKKRPARATS